MANVVLYCLFIDCPEREKKPKKNQGYDTLVCSKKKDFFNKSFMWTKLIQTVAKASEMFTKSQVFFI
jgi:hypothetical protein